MNFNNTAGFDGNSPQLIQQAGVLHEETFKQVHLKLLSHQIGGFNYLISGNEVGAVDRRSRYHLLEIWAELLLKGII